MTEQEMLQLALDAGFANAAIVDTADIVIDYSFRPYCAENLCGQYGAITPARRIAAARKK